MNEQITLTGTLYWVMTDNPDPLYNDYRTTLYPDQASLPKAMDLQSQGVKNTLRKDDIGYNLIYRRRHEQDMRGKKVVLGPPQVAKADGTPLKGSEVGNGSKGAIILELYSHKTPQGRQSKAARLASVRVDELVPFNREELDDRIPL